MAGLVGAMVSFEEGHELLHELAGVNVPTKHVERAAEALGREVTADEKLVVEPPGPNEPLAPTLYLGMDGTGVPVRKKELVDRPGKQPDGSSKTREVKLVTIWSAEGRDKEGTPVRDAGSISYSAAVESAAHKDTDATPSVFAARVVREATRRGFDRAARQAVLGDGATWIWNLADEHFPDAVQIVDRFHAKQHLSDVSKSIYAAGSDLAQQWASERHDELDAGDIDDILDALRVHSPKDEEARKCIGYVERNRERMRYPKFRAAGLCTSTGVVEAGCKVAIGTRCKRAGMHWTVAGVDAIIALRCCKLSGRFEDFWERRAQRRVPDDRFSSHNPDVRPWRSCRLCGRGIHFSYMPLRALLVLSLALSCPVAAFEGRIVDQNGDAVAGANVALLATPAPPEPIKMVVSCGCRTPRHRSKSSWSCPTAPTCRRLW